MERAAGIEPASSAWKAEVIAIIRCTHVIRQNYLTLNMVEGDGFEPSKLTRQIYSLLPLATREPLQILISRTLNLEVKDDGADYRSRTGDLLITSQLLYLLS